MKNYVYTIILLLFFIKSGLYAQCDVTVTANSKCEGTALVANTSGGIVEQLKWNWQSRKDSTLIIKTVAPQYAGYITVAGGNGEGNVSNQIEPIGICIDKQGNIYVADNTNNRVQKWVPGAIEGITVAGGNGFGSAANQLAIAWDVAVDDEGNVYVSDLYNHRVQKWLLGAVEGVTVAGGNGEGSAANQLAYPNGIFLDQYRNLYIADNNNNRIQKWVQGATEGKTVAGGNGEGNADNQTPYPKGIFVDTAGSIYVTGDDYYTNRVQKWLPGATEGVTVAGGIFPGSGSNQLNYPSDVFVDHLGNLFVADKFNGRVQKYFPGADTAVTVGYMGQTNSVFVIGDTVYVADGGNLAVQQFIPVNVPPVDNSFTPSFGGNYTATALFKQGCISASNAVHIKALPKFKGIKGQQRNLCGGGTFVYSVDATGDADSYNWTAPVGCTIVNGQGTASITLSIPANFVSGVLSVTADNNCGTGPVFADTLTTSPAKPGDIHGPTLVSSFQTFTYSIDPQPGISYRWEVPVEGVVIVSGQNTPSVTIAWNSFAYGGNIIVKASACAGGTESSSRLLLKRFALGINANDGSALLEKSKPEKLKVYPNPAQDKATLTFAAKGAYNIQITDAAGKLIKTIKGNAATGENKVDIDISRMSKGIYFITLLAEKSKQAAILNKQ